MTWNVLDNITNTGNGQTDLVNTLIAPSQTFPIFWALVVLIPMFLIITGRSFFKQKEREGRGEILSSLAVAGFSTSMVAVVMNLIGLIDRLTLGWTLGVSIVFIVIFILLKE